MIERNTVRLRHLRVSKVPFRPFQEWEPILQATKAISPDFCLDGVDVLASFSKLRSLLLLCAGEDEARRVHFHLAVINNTLVISSEGRFARPQFMLDEAALTAAKTGGSTMGSDFEKAFATWPKGLEASGNHTRVLQYNIGNLNCVVTAGIDACFKPELDENASSPLQDIHLTEGPASTGHILKRYGNLYQYPVAEVKGHFMPERSWHTRAQLWFNRADFVVGAYCDWMIRRLRVRKIKVLEADALRHEWEESEVSQTLLRKLVTLLTELRNIVNGTKYKHCFITRPRHDAAYPWTLDVHVIEDGTASQFEVDARKYWQKDDP